MRKTPTSAWQWTRASACFPATLWTSARAAGASHRQVWFSGMPRRRGRWELRWPGGVDAGTRLCDITLGWMAAKRRPSADDGSHSRSAVWNFAAKFALDAIRESWRPPCGPQHLRRRLSRMPRSRTAVAVRVQYALTYTPGNLLVNDAGMVKRDGYSLVTIVDEERSLETRDGTLSRSHRRARTAWEPRWLSVVTGLLGIENKGLAAN